MCFLIVSRPIVIIKDFPRDQSFVRQPFFFFFAPSSPGMYILVKRHFIYSLLLMSAALFLFSGSDIKVPVAILNCLYARQLCFEDASCSAILEIIPRVCGPELGK